MTIHFAAAEGNLRARLTPAQARAAVNRAANDNMRDFAAGLPLAGDETQAILHAALRQFAAHGIGAAAHARQQAEQAFFAGDRQTYQWWLGICRTLDRRMASALANKAGAGEANPNQANPNQVNRETSGEPGETA